MNDMPETLVHEVMISLKDALHLSAQDTWRDIPQVAPHDRTLITIVNYGEINHAI